MTDFNTYTLLHQKRPKEKDKDMEAEAITPNTIMVYNPKQIEKNVTHELEHLILYRLLLKNGCEEQAAHFACHFINNPSDGDIEYIKTMLNLSNYRKWNTKKLNKITQPFDPSTITITQVDRIPPITRKHKR